MSSSRENRWLGYNHPDPAGVKCKLMRQLLEGIVNGTSRVQAYWMAMIIFAEKGIKPAKLSRDFSDGYVWMDYLSIPQANKQDQAKAIASITGYVAISDLFIVLSGAWTHVDDGSIRDVRAWGERGWCRMENLANSLSPIQKSFIVAQSAHSIYSYGPSGMIGRLWYDTSEVVGRGNFAVEADKLSLGPSIKRLIDLRKDIALSSGDLPFYRFLSCIANKLLEGTGVHNPELPLHEWLAELRFTSALDETGKKRSGLTPLRFAVIANRADLVAQVRDPPCISPPPRPSMAFSDLRSFSSHRQILEVDGVDLESPIRPPKKGTTAASMFLAGQTILITACLYNEVCSTRTHPQASHATLTRTHPQASHAAPLNDQRDRLS